jgi:hypothetical protein
LASAGQAAQLAVLVHGVADPVGAGILQKGCVSDSSRGVLQRPRQQGCVD